MFRILKKFTKNCGSLLKKSNRIASGIIISIIGFTLIVGGYLPLPKN